MFRTAPSARQLHRLTEYQCTHSEDHLVYWRLGRHLEEVARIAGTAVAGCLCRVQLHDGAGVERDNDGAHAIVGLLGCVPVYFKLEVAVSLEHRGRWGPAMTHRITLREDLERKVSPWLVLEDRQVCGCRAVLSGEEKEAVELVAVDGYAGNGVELCRRGAEEADGDELRWCQWVVGGRPLLVFGSPRRPAPRHGAG